MFDTDIFCDVEPLPSEVQVARYRAKLALLKLRDAWRQAYGEELDDGIAIGDWPEVPNCLRRQAN